jgi:MFS superfamily sulfate permease-like transporter
VLNWLGKMVGLSNDFLPFIENENGQELNEKEKDSHKGGGVILVRHKNLLTYHNFDYIFENSKLRVRQVNVYW